MRLALLSFSHHGRSMAQTAQNLGHEIVGVMDAEEQPRQRLVDDFQCTGFDSAESCLDAIKPDAALVAGKHVEMPSHIGACVDRRVPYLLDKPFADCAARLRPVAEASDKHGVFSALTLPNRASQIVKVVQEMVEDGSLGDLVLYNSRLNNGPPSRYDPTPSSWHNDPQISGGGCWGVEAAHGIDTFLQFVGDQKITVVGAVMSNAMHRRCVEDIAMGILRADDGVTGIVESGYCYPSGVRAGDHFLPICWNEGIGVPTVQHTVARRSLKFTPPKVLRLPKNISRGGNQGVMGEAFSALSEGRTFEPNILTAVRVLEVQDAVYDFARKSTMTNGPHAMGAPAPRP